MRKFFLLLTVMVGLITQVLAQSRQVSGKVTDEKGNPVPGASISIKEMKIGTTTKEDGTFSISVPDNAKTLVVSGVGFGERKMQIGNGIISVVLEKDDKKLDEVVVTANSIKRDKRSLGYSAPVIKADELTRGENSSAISALQGKIAGANITGTAAAPGSSSRIVLRGGSSITGNNQALIIIDGVPIDNSSIIGGGIGSTTSVGGSALTSIDFGNRGNDINSEDIESVTVLKGPAAAALYGSRASNGALVITTKTGKKNQNKKNEISFNSSFGFSNILKLPDFQNEYGQGYNDPATLAGIPTSDPKENWSWGPKFDGVVRPWGQKINGKRLERAYSAVSDNVKNFFRTGTTYTNNLSFSGAAEKSTYYLSLSALNSDGIMPGNSDKYNKYGVRFNGSTELTNKFTSSISLSYTKINSSVIQGGQGGGSVYNSVLQTPRSIPLTDLKDMSNPYYKFGGLYDADGNELFGYYGAYTINPYYVLENYKNQNNVDRITGSISLSYKANDWLNFTERLGTDVYSDRRVQKTPKFSLIPVDTTLEYSGVTQNGSGYYGISQFNLSEIVNDMMVTAKKDLTKDIRGSLMVGNNVRSRVFTTLENSTNGGLVIPGWHDLDNSKGPILTNDTYAKRRLVGVYSELNLSYKDYLFLGGTARNDWSSTLPKGHNSFFYSSVNGAFVFSELMKSNSKLNWLNYGKVRASIAQVGNDADPYLLSTTYSKTSISSGYGTTTYPLNGVPGYSKGDRIGNSALKPEITTAYEVGAELGFWDNRVYVDFSYYSNQSKNQILAVPIPPASGFTSRVMNAGLVTNKGVEISLRVAPIRTSNLTWELYGTYTKNKNLIKELDVDQVVLGGFNGMSIVAAKGQPYGAFYGPDLARDSMGHVIVSATTGLPLVSSTSSYLGSYNPKFMASLGTNVTYKGFAFNILFDTKQGGKFFSRTKDITDFVGVAAETVDYNRAGDVFKNSVVQDASGKYIENTSVKFLPQNYYSSIIPDGQHVIDASYIKLREVSLSYKLPQTLLNKTPFGNASIGVYGNNLWIKTAKENRYADPEINSTGSGNDQGFDFTAQPSVKNYGVNLKITF